jgi:replicative DNA helicase
MLLDRDAAAEAFDALGPDPEVFHEEGHQAVYAAMLDLRREGHGIDVNTVIGELRRTGRLDTVGGVSALADLTGRGTLGLLDSYTGQLLDAATRRALILRANRLAAEAEKGGTDARELVADMARDLEALAARHSTGAAVRVGDDLDPLLARFESVRVGGGIIGLPTGFNDLDRITGGFRPGSVTILAARPSVGKTAFALNLAANVAEAGAPVAFFSLEMSALDLRERLALSLGGFDLRGLHGLDPGALAKRIGGAIERLAALPLFIDDRAAITPLDLRAAMRAAVRKHGVRFVVIDYLQLMRPESRRHNGTRNDEVTELSGCVRAAAKEFGLPVLVLSQLSRLGDCDEPRLSHLRESGSIEQDADVVILLSKERADGTVIRAHVAKNRTGQTGVCSLVFDKPTQSFKPFTAQTPEGAAAMAGVYDDDDNNW